MTLLNILIALMRSFVMNNRFLLMNMIVKRTEVPEMISELINAMEAVEDDLRDVSMLELLLLILYGLLLLVAAAVMITVDAARGMAGMVVILIACLIGKVNVAIAFARSCTPYGKIP